MLNLRGEVVPVVDLGAKLGLGASEITKRSCIVFVEPVLGEGQESGRTPMGVLVDSVSQVLELAPDEIDPAPAFADSVRADYLSGLGRLGKGLVLLLDIDKVLASDEIFAAIDLAAEPEAPPEAVAEEPRGSAPGGATGRAATALEARSYFASS